MKTETVDLLHKAVLKWNEVCMGLTGAREFQCPLCVRFRRRYVSVMPGSLLKDSCSGCPVREKTGKDMCLHSPYIDWKKASMDGYCTVGSAEQSEALLIFLISLLPEKERERYGGG